VRLPQLIDNASSLSENTAERCRIVDSSRFSDQVTENCERVWRLCAQMNREGSRGAGAENDTEVRKRFVNAAHGHQDCGAQAGISAESASYVSRARRPVEAVSSQDLPPPPSDPEPPGSQLAANLFP
jgi:hypothetical protein